MTVDYVPIATGATADVESQAQYLIDLAPGGTLQNGFQTGVAQSNQFNKVVRQSSVMSASVANFIAGELGGDVLDDGNVPALVVLIKAAIIHAVGSPFSTGDGKMTLKTVADSGWVMCNDGSIGSATSGATTRANADCQALFTLLWNNIADAWAPVNGALGNRGVSAAADWAANKPINLTKNLGRALAISGAGAGLTNRALGSFLGEEQHVLTVNELANHSHPLVDPGHVHVVNDPHHTHVVNDPGHSHQAQVIASGEGSVPGAIQTTGGGPLQTSVDGTGISINAAATGISINAAVTGITSGAQGGGLGHNTMQPSAFWNVMIKL